MRFQPTLFQGRSTIRHKVIKLIAKKVSKKIANMANLITIFTFELFTQITSNFVSIHNMSFQGVGVLKRTCLTFSRNTFGILISQIGCRPAPPLNTYFKYRVSRRTLPTLFFNYYILRLYPLCSVTRCSNKANFNGQSGKVKI